MLEDTLGLNIHGLKTIGAVFWNPKRVFAAARSKTWANGTYRPSIRLFVSLAMLVLVLQAFWAGPDSHLAQISSENIQTILTAQLPPELIPYISGRDIWQTSIVALPIATVATMLIAAFLLRIWGKGTRGVTRIRYYFLAAIPGWICSFGLSMTAEAFSFATAVILLVAAQPVAILLDSLTAWRGNPGEYKKFARIWRAGLFGVVNFVVYNIAAFIMLTYASHAVTQNVIAAAKAAGVVLAPS